MQHPPAAGSGDGARIGAGGGVELALAPPATDRPAGLTERELEVLALVIGGLTNEQVAARLFLSARTVNWRLTAVCRKLGCALAGRGSAFRRRARTVPGKDRR